MKIDIARLADQQETVLVEDWDAQVLDLNVPGWEYAGPVHVQATVVRDAGLIRAQVRLQARANLVCCRCLKEFDSSFEKTVRLVYASDLSQKTLVLDDDIRQEVILGYPQKILCQQGCKGLCSRCGKDLNEGECKCVRTKKE
ncbi:MAG: DUF177 domain-containing protein [Candidatus Omnitrophota bacterium]